MSRNGAARYIGSQFNESYIVDKARNPGKALKREDPDIVVYEVVERYADKLKTFTFLAE